MMQEILSPKTAAGESPSSVMAMPVSGVLKTAGSSKRAVTFGVLCVAALIEGADLQLLPASFRAVEAELGFAPSSLAILTLLQGCSGALAGPFWASLADNGFSRRLLLTVGTAGWGMLTLILASVHSFSSMAILRILNGILLGMMLPVTQSLLAEISDKGELGFMFGCLQFYTNFGQVFGAVAVTTMSNQVFYGVGGWRWAFTAVGISSFATSGCVLLGLQEEPRRWTPERVSISLEFKKFMSYLKVRSFLIIVLQGMFGMVPWAALTFTTMYFQYLGLSDIAAALVYGMAIVGTALGGVVGGVTGDHLAAWSPNHGRALTAQITVSLGIPFVICIFLVVPYNAPPVLYALLCFGLGIFSSWASSGCNRPICTEIVPPGSRASAMAWEVTLESMCGFLFGPAAVGMLSEHAFGYQMSKLQVPEMSQEARLTNARALGHSMVFITTVMWLLCLLSYTILHFTLAADVLGAKQKAGRLGGADFLDSHWQPTEATPFALLVSGSIGSGSHARDSIRGELSGEHSADK